MSVNAREETFQEVELFGNPALFTNSRIDSDTVPDGWYCYDLRGSDYDPGRPVTVEPRVVVNHAGSVLTHEPVKFRKNQDSRRLRDGLNFVGGNVTLEQFCEEHKLTYPADNQKYKLRPASESEAGLFYAATPEKDEALGCIGNVRMDFGRGKEFWTTWWPRGKESLNSPEFKEELGEVVDAMRKTVLKDLDAMSRYCNNHGGAISGGYRQNYGYIVDTDHYRYCLRCNPQPGDYQAYLTCFDMREQKLNQKESPSMEVLLHEREYLNEMIQACDEDIHYFSGAQVGDGVAEYQASVKEREKTVEKLNAVEQQIADLKKAADALPVIGTVSFASGETLAYTDSDIFLQVIKDELPYKPTSGFAYKVLTDDPKLRKAVDDILFDMFGEENPRPLEDYGLSEKGRKALKDCENPNLPHRYNWFVVENFCCEGETRHDTDSLTGAIDKFNGLNCGEKRLCVTKDDVATIYLAITHDGETHLDDSWLDNPRFEADTVIEEAAERLQLSIAGLEQSGPAMTMGGMQ
ncbi:MAG: hypothetical protein PHU76_01785 [Synergistaceae bacterium]|nr:hypothetical protein [Proteiniphilum sp.]MDD3963171.1 hypothetical protein [Synergistaceae bacterium]